MKINNIPRLEKRHSGAENPIYVKVGPEGAEITMTSVELLTALSDKAFKNDAPISINTGAYDGRLTVAYMCPKNSGCGRLHLIACKQWSPTYDESGMRVLINRTNCADADGVTKNELEKVLRSIGKNVEITVTTEKDEDELHYPLLTAIKCPHCDSAHLYSQELVEKE